MTIGKLYWELPIGIADVTEYKPVMGMGRDLPDRMWELYEFISDWSRVTTSTTSRGLEISHLFDADVI